MPDVTCRRISSRVGSSRTVPVPEATAATAPAEPEPEEARMVEVPSSEEELRQEDLFGEIGIDESDGDAVEGEYATAVQAEADGALLWGDYNIFPGSDSEDRRRA